MISEIIFKFPMLKYYLQLIKSIPLHGSKRIPLEFSSKFNSRSTRIYLTLKTSSKVVSVSDSGMPSRLMFLGQLLLILQKVQVHDDQNLWHG